MFRNYFKTAWRNLKVSKFYSLINIGGLAIGLATGIMLLLWVQNERSYDKFNHNYKNIYNLSAHFPSNGGQDITWSGVPGPLAVYARSLPQVKAIVRIYAERGQLLSNADQSRMIGNNTVECADPGFFPMFDFKLAEGNKSQLFLNNNSIVLSYSTAKKIFGTDNALGKIVVFNKENFTVTGIMEDFPGNSTLQYDAIIPMGYYAAQFTAGGGNGKWKTIDEDIGNYAFNTFVLLQPGADPVKTGKDFSAAFKNARNGDGQTSFLLQNLAEIHLTGPDGNDAQLKMVRIFTLVAILLLLIAGINYVNLSTARSLIRAREVSIRKIVGAGKLQLFLQFISETFVLFCIATVFAILLAFLLMPLYNQVSGKQLHFSLTDPQVWEVIGLATLGMLLAASIYPAMLLSSFRPIQSLKGKISAGVGTVLFRKALVVFQFAISVALMISTLVISHQMKYIRNKDLGYDKSYVFTVPLPDEAAGHRDAIKNELSAQPGILNVSVSNVPDISAINSSTSDLDWKGKLANNNFIINQANIDKDFIPAMKIQFLEGGNFTGMPADSAHFILNETAVKAMGLKPPYIGQPVKLHDWNGSILGVVKDFNFKSLKDPVTPLIFFNRWKGNILYVRTTAKDAQQAIAAAENQYKKYAGKTPFNYNFVDKQFEATYRSDQRTGALFNIFAIIAIFISSLGLFGLATYTAQVRTKEIGIRKVLGATAAGITSMISKDFLKLVIIAIIVAIPAAWWGMNKWLQNFAYHIHISWWMFATAGILAILIALVTVAYQSVKAAIANPIEALRSE